MGDRPPLERTEQFQSKTGPLVPAVLPPGRRAEGAAPRARPAGGTDVLGPGLAGGGEARVQRRRVTPVVVEPPVRCSTPRLRVPRRLPAHPEGTARVAADMADRVVAPVSAARRAVVAT